MQGLFVSRKDVGGLASILCKCLSANLLGAFAMILRIADAAQHVSRRQVIRINLQLGHSQLHGRDLVVVVINRKVAWQARGRRFAAQKPCAKRVKRRNPRLPGRDARAQEQIRDAIAHFFRGFVSEGHREDGVCGDPLGDQVGHAIGDGAGLARSCAC